MGRPSFLDRFMGVTAALLLLVIGPLAACNTIPTTAYKPRATGNPKALQPRSVEHVGTLTPVTGLQPVIEGNTLVIVQPWVGLDKFEFRENPIYFRNDGLADSQHWVDVAWFVGQNDICVTGTSVDNCYTAYVDDKGQAYLLDQKSNLLAKVSSIEAGDAYGVRAAYEERVRQQEAQAAMMAAFAGLLFESMLGGGGGGGSDPRNDPVERARQDAIDRTRMKHQGF